jgi:hypothetical protein
VDTKRLSKRIYIYWGVALTLLVTAGLACWFVVVPVMEVRAVVRDFAVGPGPASEYTTRLGGPERAETRLASFVSLPSWTLGSQDRHDAARFLGFFMRWERACELYRTTAYSDVKVGLAVNLFPGIPKPPRQFSKDEVVRLFGKPDGVEDDGAIFIYTGEGRVSDGMSGFLLYFDKQGKLKRVVAAN